MLLRAAIPNTWKAEVGRRLEFKSCLVHSETSCQPRGKSAQGSEESKTAATARPWRG